MDEALLLAFVSFDLREMMLRLPVVLFALTVHEFAHAYSAHKLGDDTAKSLGRMTLNPLDHLDPMGTICIMFAPIGWAKPVPVDKRNFRNPGRDDIIVSIAGPISNLILATGFALGMRIFSHIALANESLSNAISEVLWLGLLVNVGLACFNMIPVFPLDGHHVVRELLPPGPRISYMKHVPFGPFIILGMVLLVPQFLTVLILPVVKFYLRFIAGIG